MPHETLKMLSEQLWELRAQCERKLRALTEAQRLVDEYAMQPKQAASVKPRLLLNLDQIIKLDSAALESARQCRSVGGILPS